MVGSLNIWWVHWLATLVALLFVVKTVATLSVVFNFLGSVFLISHAAVLIAFYLRRRLAGTVDSNNKAVLVTGCDSGFGHLLVKRLDALGFYVFAGCLYPDGEGAIALRAQCANVETLRLDVTKDDDVTKAAQEVRAKLNGMDLWAVVNNAGIPCLSEVEWCPMSAYRQTLEVNLFGMIRITQAFLPLVRACKGRIVNVNSGLGRLNVPGASAYCISKHGSVALTDCLRIEMRRWGVKVSGIEPWFYKTDMTTTENCLAVVHKAWPLLSPEVLESYGTAYYQSFVERIQRFLTKSNRPYPMEVVDCMVDAISSTEPSEVYCPRGNLDLVRLELTRIIPEPVLDPFIEKDMEYDTMIPSACQKTAIFH